jgi:hypothetical protein
VSEKISKKYDSINSTKRYISLYSLIALNVSHFEDDRIVLLSLPANFAFNMAYFPNDDRLVMINGVL